jgi:hypothetical protein
LFKGKVGRKLTVTEPVPPAAAKDEHRLDVEGAWSPPYGGSITSWKRRTDGTRVLHGVQVIAGANNWLKEYAVYNNGTLEQRTQFYPSGHTFRFQRREKNGDGYEVVYAPTAKGMPTMQHVPIYQPVTLSYGQVKADRRWEGTFLTWEPIAHGYTTRLVLQEYHNGKWIKSTPFSSEKLGLPANVKQHAGWLWNATDWPKPDVVRHAADR